MPSPPALPPLPSALGFTEAITIWLTILGVMVALACLVVTGVGVFVGALALWGYGTFKEEVRTRAADAAKIAAEEYFRGKAFDDKIKENIIGATWQSGTTGMFRSSGAIAKRYPKKGDRQ